MIKRNKSGQVVEFEDDKVFSVGVDHLGPASKPRPTTREEIDAEFEAAVRETTEKSVRSLEVALKALETQVIAADETAKRHRTEANAKFAQAKRAAEKHMAALIAVAEEARVAEIADIRAAFYATMTPINNQVGEIKATHQKALDVALEGLATFRKKQIAMLAGKEVAEPTKPEEAPAS
jgi:hypothetical protein